MVVCNGVRVWHKHGVLANEERYWNGLLPGVCRQWSEAGRLLGKYRMVHGTGVQRNWHENGRLQLEFSTVRGDFSGRYRLWLNDGKLMSEDILLHGKPDALPFGEQRFHRAGLPVNVHNPNIFMKILKRN